MATEMAAFHAALTNVQPGAGMSEIRSAFKKRALEVHPDKGGSQEAWHLVRTAFEQLAGCEEGPKRKAPKKFKHEPVEATVQRWLGQLPREERHEMIKRHFSQAQRLLLERWIEQSSKPAQPQDTSGTQRKCQKDLGEEDMGLVGQSLRCSRSCGSLKYRASMDIMGVAVSARMCDLPAALEQLVILAAAKTSLQAATPPENLCLRSALEAAVKERGKDLQESWA
ncbi:unnamed protein product [Effrenium voratum]|nr:unnamed protein product [Effrenium voratum]